MKINKKIILQFIILQLLIIHNVKGQDSLLVKTNTAIVANEKLNDFYLGINNPLLVSFSGKKECKLHTDNGQIIKDEEEYYIKPSKAGKCNITLSSIDGKIKENFVFRVRIIPKPVVFISNSSPPEISKGLICHGAIILYIPNTDIDIFFKVEYFDMLITTGEGKIFSFSNTSNQFTLEMKEQLCILKTKDVVTIYNVKASYGSEADKKAVEPDPVTFILK